MPGLANQNHHSADGARKHDGETTAEQRKVRLDQQVLRNERTAMVSVSITPWQK